VAHRLPEWLAAFFQTMRRIRLLGLVAAGSLCTLNAVSACDSSGESSSSAGVVTNPAGFDGGTTEDGSVGPGSDGSTTTDAGNDAAPSAPRDPFAAQSKPTRDAPLAADYTVDVAKGTVTDKTTGLLWSRAALTEAELPPDGGDGSPTSQIEARTQCETATLGGTKGWRLPTRIELLTIVSIDQAHVHEPTAFDGPTFENQPLWAASDDLTRAAYYEGHYNPKTFRGNLNASWAAGGVHCVKAPYPVTANAAPPPAGRFSAAGNVLTDSVTHLEWFTKPKLAFLQYTDATTYCATGAAADGAPAGAKPWRLPTLKEAASLWLESSKGFPAAFGLSSGFYFWTSAHYQPQPGLIASPGYFRFVLDDTVPSGNFYWEVNDFASAVCVRDGT
jgi:hypothetical protein